MRNGKHGLKALGLSFLAALGLMAFMAAGAQAVTWDVAGKELTENGQELDGAPKGEGLLLVPAQNVIIHCKNFTVDEGQLIVKEIKDAEGKTIASPNTAHGGLLFSSCLTLVSGVDQPKCSNDVANGITILQAKAKIKPVLHNGSVYLLAEPLTSGGNFTQIHYGPECALPLVNIKGSVLLECENGSLVHRSCSFAAAKQLIKPVANQALLSDELKYGLNPATLDGEAEVFLKGKNEGQTFNALI